LAEPEIGPANHNTSDKIWNNNNRFSWMNISSENSCFQLDLKVIWTFHWKFPPKKTIGFCPVKIQTGDTLALDEGEDWMPLSTSRNKKKNSII
jgi:hypothetical protein